jgi:uncharacterized protein HemX
MGNPIRVSQALSAVLVIGAVLVMFYQIKIKKATPETLWVNRTSANMAGEDAESSDVPSQN